MLTKKQISIFSSTKLIEIGTLNVIKNNPEIFEVVILVAGNNTKKLTVLFSPKNKICDFYSFPSKKSHLNYSKISIKETIKGRMSD